MREDYGNKIYGEEDESVKECMRVREDYNSACREYDSCSAKINRILEDLNHPIMTSGFFRCMAEAKRRRGLQKNYRELLQERMEIKRRRDGYAELYVKLNAAQSV